MTTTDTRLTPEQRAEVLRRLAKHSKISPAPTALIASRSRSFPPMRCTPENWLFHEANRRDVVRQHERRA
jgi:hypothetical protein